MILLRRKPSLFAHLLLAFSIISMSTGWVRAEETPAQAMARAIARMMESMGFNNAASTLPTPAPMMPPGAEGWPSAFAPWSGAVAPSMPSASAMSQMADRVYQGMTSSGDRLANGWSPGILEGVWEDNLGGVLIVQGTLYRLYSSCNGHIDGDIRILDDRIELTNRQQNFSQNFEYALDQGRLALRDQSGQIFLYRRLVLNRDE